MHAEFRFHFDRPQAAPRFADEAREASARLGNDLPPEQVQLLMHYDAQGPAKGFPLVQFVHRPGGFAIVAYGKTASVIEPLIEALAQRWARHTQSPVRVHVRRFSLYAEESLRPTRYRIDRLVIQKKPWQLKLMRELGEETYLARLIRNGLRQQASTLGVPLPAFDIDEVRIVRYLESSPVPLDPKKTSAAFASVSGLEFALPLILEGRWAVGYLRARGYGGIYPLPLVAAGGIHE